LSAFAWGLAGPAVAAVAAKAVSAVATAKLANLFIALSLFGKDVEDGRMIGPWRTELKCRLRMILMHLTDERPQSTAAIHSFKKLGWLRSPKLIAPVGTLL
jgi:hypothetical protein